jgi:hypothetical protein
MKNSSPFSAIVSFTNKRWIRQLLSVRISLALCVSLLLAISARAQEQEQKLLDRLLKPQTTLQNSSQNKKFVADGASIDKKATVKPFYVQEKSEPKGFPGTRNFRSTDFNAKSFYNARDTSHFGAMSARDPGKTFATSTSTSIRPANDRDKKSKTRQFAEQGPFLDKGKSQKSLDRHNPPMTIEQVRELLNKN